MIEQTHWRLALMLGASDNNLVSLEQRMKKSTEAIRTITYPQPVRLGIADRHPDLIGTGRYLPGWEPRLGVRPL